MAWVGTALLVVAVVASVLSASLAWLHKPAAARRALDIGVAALVFAVAILAIALVRVDLGLAYVGDHSRSASSVWYRLAALWAGSQGSLLMFTAGLAVVGWWSANSMLGSGPTPKLGAAGIVGVHAATVLVFANPFEAAPGDTRRGTGLTPILEHPAMLWHPPLLYGGLVLTFAAYLRALAGDDDRQSLLAAWAVLTAGLVTGSNWAYAELGWGGYWGWDPVENTALVVWLALAAVLHYRSPRASWNAALQMAPFALTLVGSAVTRSGRLSSVHAFADAGALAWALAAITVAALAAIICSARAAPSSGPLVDSPGATALGPAAAPETVEVGSEPDPGPAGEIGMDSGRLASGDPQSPRWRWLGAGAAALAATAAAVLLVGLVAPLIGAVVGARSFAVQSWFYARMLAPLAVIAAALAGIAVWPRRGRRRIGQTLAHIGFAVLLVGVFATTGTDTRLVAVAPGDSIEVGSLSVNYDDFVVEDGPRRGTEQVRLHLVAVDGDTRQRLTPALVSFPLEGITLPEVDTWSTWSRDVQVFVRSVDRSGIASVDLAVRPLISLVWLGATLTTAGMATASIPRPRD